MSLSSWADNGWLHAHDTTPHEITNLQRIVDRELTDAAIPRLSQDARLGMLYNAALKLADIALRAAGFRATGGSSQHYRIIMSIPQTLGADWQTAADFLDATRQLRNRADYESVGFATQQHLDELREIVLRLRAAVPNVTSATD